MFLNTKAFSSFSVDSLANAKAFYAGVLGIDVYEHEGELNLNIVGGTSILLYLKEENHTPATFTVLNFPVDNIEQTVDELTLRGVRFEQYDGYVKTDAKGIFRSEGIKQAWFKDPSGNILSLLETEPS